MKPYNIETFIKTATRAERKSLKAALEEVDDLLLTSDHRRVVIFSNGISDYGFKRLLALHRLGKPSFDWKEANGCVSSYERNKTEAEIREYFNSANLDQLYVLSDSAWLHHPMDESLYEFICGADVIIEVQRQRQRWLNDIAEAVRRGFDPDEVILMIEGFMVEPCESEPYEPYCSEYQYVDLAVHHLLGRDMTDRRTRGEIPDDTWNFIITRVLDIPNDDFSEWRR